MSRSRRRMSNSQTSAAIWIDGAMPMTYAADHTDFPRYAMPEQHAADRGGILRRISNAIFRSRQRHADMEIARFIARSGGRFTDDIERQMMARISRAAFGESGQSGFWR